MSRPSSEQQEKQQQQVLQHSLDQSMQQQSQLNFQQGDSNNSGSGNDSRGGNNSSSSNHNNNNNNSNTNNNNNDNNDNKPKRNPFCSRCRGHGKSCQVKGHKRHCEYKDCKCEGCELVHMRQLVSAAQIKRRRYQKQDEECGRKIEVSGPVLARDSTQDRDPLAAANMTLMGSSANEHQQQIHDELMQMQRKQHQNHHELLQMQRKQHQNHHALMQMHRKQHDSSMLAGVLPVPPVSHYNNHHNGTGGLTPPTTTPTLLHPLNHHLGQLNQHQHHRNHQHHLTQTAATSQHLHLNSPPIQQHENHHLAVNTSTHHLHNQAGPSSGQFHLGGQHAQRLSSSGSPPLSAGPTADCALTPTTGAMSSSSSAVTPIGHHHQHQHHPTNQALSNALQLLQFPNSVIHTAAALSAARAAAAAAAAAANVDLPAANAGSRSTPPCGDAEPHAFHNHLQNHHQQQQQQRRHHHLLTQVSNSSIAGGGGDCSTATSVAASTAPAPLTGIGSRSSATTEYSPTNTSSPILQPAPREQINIVEEIYDTFGPLAIYAWFRAEQFDEQKIRDTIEHSRAPFDELLQITGHSPLDLTSPIVDV